MVLDFAQKIEVLKQNPRKSYITAAREHARTVSLHLYGGDAAKKEIKNIDSLESKVLYDLRLKYFRSNRALFERLARPIDKVFSAKGGSIYLGLSGETEKKAKNLLADVTGGQSVRKLVENLWKPHYLDDPNGVILIEKYANPIYSERKAKGEATCYPVYIATASIYDYDFTGDKLEYLVIELTEKDLKSYGVTDPLLGAQGSILDSKTTKKAKYFRLIDDSTDEILALRDDTVNRLDSIANSFGYVPAMLCGDIVNTADPEKPIRVSLFNPVIELATEYMQENSIHRTHRLLHGFPKYWEYADTCKTCKGTGLVSRKVCPDCAGSKRSIMSRVSDVKVLSHPDSKDSPVIAPNVAGYVSPDEKYHTIATAIKQLLEAEMYATQWGDSSAPKVTGPQGAKDKTQTATEIVNDLKPQADRLNPISDVAERVHKFIADAVIRCDIDPQYAGANVNYGRRFLLEGPDELYTKYQDAKTKGVAVSVLDDMLNDYLEAKFQSDPLKLAIKQKLAKVEPFVHMSTQQVQALALDDSTYKAKAFFSEWLAQYDEAKLYTKNVAALTADLYAYADSKQLAPKEKKPLQVA